eukprot:349634-Chlamydomonas_euryale.AAC.18
MHATQPCQRAVALAPKKPWWTRRRVQARSLWPCSHAGVQAPSWHPRPHPQAPACRARTRPHDLRRCAARRPAMRRQTWSCPRPARPTPPPPPAAAPPRPSPSTAAAPARASAASATDGALQAAAASACPVARPGRWHGGALRQRRSELWSVRFS